MSASLIYDSNFMFPGEAPPTAEGLPVVLIKAGEKNSIKFKVLEQVPSGSNRIPDTVEDTGSWRVTGIPGSNVRKVTCNSGEGTLSLQVGCPVLPKLVLSNHAWYCCNHHLHS